MSEFEYDDGIARIEKMLLAVANSPVPDVEASWQSFAARLPERRPSLHSRFVAWTRRPLTIAFATGALSTGAAYAAGLEPHRGIVTAIEKVSAGLGLTEPSGSDSEIAIAADAEAAAIVQTGDDSVGENGEDIGIPLDGFVAASGSTDDDFGSDSDNSGPRSDSSGRGGDADDDDDNSGSGSGSSGSGSDGDDDDDDDNSGSGSGSDDEDNSGSGDDDDDDDDVISGIIDEDNSGPGGGDDDSGSGDDDDDDDDDSESDDGDDSSGSGSDDDDSDDSNSGSD